MRAIGSAPTVAAFVALGWRQAAAERAAMTGRAIMFALPIAIFAAIWRATPLSEVAGLGDRPEPLIWYVAATEWLAFSIAMLYRDTEREIQSGEIAIRLTRPIPYAAAILAEWAGAVAFRLAVLGPLAIVLAYGLTGELPLDFLRAVGLLISGALAAFLWLLFQLLIALATVWFGTAGPFYWIWQKLTFVLGGLFIPLSVYPALVRDVAMTTPFAAMLYGPASLVMDTSASWSGVAAAQLSWLTFVGIVAVVLSRAAEARMTAEGA
jgi:ABC-2 type transport system permease protein